MGPNPNEARPNPDIPGLVYIKNTIKNPNIIVGDYTYYKDIEEVNELIPLLSNPDIEYVKKKIKEYLKKQILIYYAKF